MRGTIIGVLLVVLGIGIAIFTYRDRKESSKYSTVRTSAGAYLIILLGVLKLLGQW